MKVFLYYEDNENSDLHKTLKITLPKSWKAGPTSKLLTQFVETYNSSAKTNTLVESDMHLSIIDGDEQLVDVPSDAITQDVIADRANVFIRHGPSTTLAAIAQQAQDAKKAQQEYKENTVACTRFGCKKRFPKGGPYPDGDCCHHVAPPVFHETAKFWSCCPNKKAYDWTDFEAIPGCQTSSVCTDVKQEDQQQFMGGVELRAQAGETSNLKSIEDFNKAQVAGSDAAPVLEQCQKVMADLGIEEELFQQVTDGMKKALSPDLTEAEVLEAVAAELGSKLKAAMKAIAVDQLRIK